jgi:hypothetical protein
MQRLKTLKYYILYPYNTSLNIKGQSLVHDIENARTIEKLHNTRVFT